MNVRQIVVSGHFDDMRSHHVRLLHEASRLGSLRILLWSDEAIARLEGQQPKFPLEERKYLLEAIRYVDQVTLADPSDRHTLPPLEGDAPAAWIVDQLDHAPAKRDYCRRCAIEYRVLREEDLQGFPELPPNDSACSSPRKKVIVSGCFDWFHSGHVRFFEEVSELGDLYVIVGHDANIRLLKGEGHPLFSQQQRRYMVQSVRFVHQALISSGSGWLDAQPEIERIRPDIYAVNEDGDQPEKRQYCEACGIEYLVLRRLPKQGLPLRQSTDLRGF